MNDGTQGRDPETAGAVRAEDPPPPEDLRVQRRFVENVERVRHGRGYSIEVLAARSSIGQDVLDQGVLEEILSCEREASLSEVCRLAGALRVKLERLYEGIDWHSPEHGGPGWVITAEASAG
jgi:transcriptional regulator with XRE-family HTH domain